MDSSVGDEEIKVRPEQVTSTNWEHLASQGFKWKENMPWPWGVSGGEYRLSLDEKLGKGNVLVGEPANEQGIPDGSIEDAYKKVGIYTKSE